MIAVLIIISAGLRGALRNLLLIVRQRLGSRGGGLSCTKIEAVHAVQTRDDTHRAVAVLRVLESGECES